MGRTVGAIALAAILVATPLASSGSPDTDEQRRGQRRPAAPKVGAKAPSVKLEYLSDGKIYDLGKSLGKRPTVLVFGSYT